MAGEVDSNTKERREVIPLISVAAKSKPPWSATAQYHVVKLSKVEKGLLQPGVMLAVRLVCRNRADVGEFFQRLWEQSSEHAHEVSDQKYAGIPDVDMAALRAEGVRRPFGPLLLQVRLHNNLRNMGKVEKGQQEPGIMAALDMVVAAEGEVGAFFGVLCETKSSD